MRKAALHLSETVLAHVPEGREKALAFTKIEEALFWSNAGIARHSQYQEEE